MIKAAGILFLCGNSALFLRRGNGGDHPNEWCCPGGKLEDGETAQQAAIRETLEEAGHEVNPTDVRLWTRTLTPAETREEQVMTATPAVPGEQPAPSEAVDFTTFLVRLEKQFTPQLCEEHDGYAWAPTTAPPQPLHPGVQVALDRLQMDELDVAEAMAAGRLTSPQKYENVWLFAIRITSTGAAYRHGRKEFVWRDPSLYLNERFLKRCNGLAVIWEHPEKSLLNSEEHADRVIGSVFLPYMRADKPEDVWAICKVYDADAVRDLQDETLSTSPAVNFSDPAVNDRITLEDGKIMLIEGKPSLLDHIAICSQGVWDKGGDPTGVESVMVTDAVADAIIEEPPRRGISSINYLRASAAALTLKVKMIA